MVAEVVGGHSGQLAGLLADAGHLLSDAAVRALALLAIWFARRPASPQHTCGCSPVKILAAGVNGAALIAIAIRMFVEAFQRLQRPPTIEAPLMMAVAAGGLVIPSRACGPPQRPRREPQHARRVAARVRRLWAACRRWWQGRSSCGSNGTGSTRWRQS